MLEIKGNRKAAFSLITATRRGRATYLPIQPIVQKRPPTIPARFCQRQAERFENSARENF